MVQRTSGISERRMTVRLVETADYKEMSDTAARMLYEKVAEKPDTVLGLATGGTPEGTYAALVKKIKAEPLNLDGLQTFNLDEYAGLSPADPNSYYKYMEKKFVSPLQLNKRQCHIPNGQAEDWEKEAERYEKIVKQSGGIDLQLLGIGENGHIGFNEPGTSFHSATHVVTLNQETREANAKYFKRQEDVPEKAITMGIGTIMKSRSVLLIVSGKRKAEALKRLMDGEVTEAFPASVLHNHPDVMIIADKEAVSLLS